MVVFLTRPEQGAGEVGLGRGGSSTSVTVSTHRRTRAAHEGMATSPQLVPRLPPAFPAAAFKCLAV